MAVRCTILRGSKLLVDSSWSTCGRSLVAKRLPAVTRLPASSVLSTSGRASFVNVNEAVGVIDVDERDGPSMVELKKRGLYANERYKHLHKYTVEKLAVSDDKKKVAVMWNDGHESRFDAIWLRHACHCKGCKHDVNGMLKVTWDQLPLDICVLSVEMEDERMMLLRWGTQDGKELHSGFIPTAALRRYCYSEKAVKERRQQKAMDFYQDKTIPHMEYEDVMSSNQAILKWVSEINERGICILKNVPCNAETFIETAEKLGPIQNTLYGQTFDVLSTANPINAAYSNFSLALHMDQPFYETSPGLQILHCWRFDDGVKGGENFFQDVHEVAHKFRREKPELFDRLATLPMHYCSVHYNRPMPVHMENQKPIFSLNHLGELVSVTWHPMVQGPVELPEEDMVPFYEAYVAFYKMLTEYQPQYKTRLSPGDFLVFNNRRVLHGREAFENQSDGQRHLRGAYIELSNFSSRSQALHNLFGDGRLSRRTGSHSWF